MHHTVSVLKVFFPWREIFRQRFSLHQKSLSSLSLLTTCCGEVHAVCGRELPDVSVSGGVRSYDVTFCARVALIPLRGKKSVSDARRKEVCSDFGRKKRNVARKVMGYCFCSVDDHSVSCFVSRNET